MLREDSLQSLQHRLGGVSWRGEQLESLEASTFGEEDDEIRERPADIDSDAQGGHGRNYKAGDEVSFCIPLCKISFESHDYFPSGLGCVPQVKYNDIYMTNITQ